VDLIGEHSSSRCGDGVGDALELLAGGHRAEGIVRVAQDEQFATVREGGGHRVVVDLPAAVDLDARHLDDPAAMHLRNHQERHVRRRGDDDGGSGTRELRDRELERRDDVWDMVHALRRHRPAVRTGVPRGGGPSEVVGEPRREIPGEAALESVVHGILDRRRDTEVHLGDEGADHVGEHRPLHAAGAAQVILGECVEVLGRHPRPPLVRSLETDPRMCRSVFKRNQVVRG
jgi:hypothetical protein